jgi:hypothetical protein
MGRTHRLKQLLEIRLDGKLGQSSDVQLPIVDTRIRSSLLASWIRDVDDELEAFLAFSVVECESGFRIRLLRESAGVDKDGRGSVRW